MTIPITEIRNVVSINDDNTEFDLEINHPDYGWIGYMLKPDDTDKTIDNDNLMTLIGTDFTSLSQSEKDSRASAGVRLQRDVFLENEVDKVVSNSLLWADLTSDEQNAWKQYRTDLLNVPQQSGFPHTITWPTKP